MTKHGRDGKNSRRSWTVLATLVLVLSGAALASDPMAAMAGEHRGGLPDLSVVELYNVTPVVVGTESYFNITLHNGGSSAYLLRSSGDLEVYAYRDGNTGHVAAFQRVYQDIYVGKNASLNMKVRYDTVGEHSLLVVIDELDRVDESDEDNNEASFDFEVVPSEENRPPEADGGNDKSGHVNVPMLFSGSESSDPDGDTLTYTWDFGDGTTGHGMRTNHTYTGIGEYGGSLTVSDGELEDVDAFTVRISEAPVNAPPTAVISVASTDILIDEELSLGSAGSGDPDPEDKGELKFDWDFDASDGVDDWVIGPTVVTSWSEPGQYTVTLRVYDGKAATTATVVVKVSEPVPPNEAPTAKAGPDLKDVDKGSLVVLYGSGSDPDGSIASYEWDTDGDGEFDTISESTGDLSWTFDEAGTYTLVLRVTDDRGATGEDSVVVTINEATEADVVTYSLSLFAVIVAFSAMFVLTLFVFVRRGGRF